MSFLRAPERTPGCASDLDLDELLSGDLAGGASESRLRAHLAGCARCRGRLAAFSAVEPPPAAAMLRGFSGAGARRAGRRGWAFALVSVAAAAAAVALVARPGKTPAPPSDTRTKGALALTIFVKRPGGKIEAVNRDGELHPGDEMRFSLASAARGYAVVLGLDAAPAVTIYAPADAAAGPIPIDATGAVQLPGSIVADATAGQERLVAVLCETAVAPQALRAGAVAALAAANGRPERVTSLGTGCLEASVLMHKSPGAR